MARTKKLPPGMCKRGCTYYARFRHAGRYVRKRLSSDFKAACDILAELRARASRGDFGLVDNDYRWADLKVEFLRWAKQALREPEAYAFLYAFYSISRACRPGRLSYGSKFYPNVLNKQRAF